MKKVLKSIAQMLAGAAVGVGGMSLIMWLVDGGLPAAHSHSEGVDAGLMLLSIGLATLWLIVAIILHLILHEAGHLIMGLLTGYQFLSFRVFKLTLVKTDKGLRWKRYHIAGTGGQCIMTLPTDQEVRTAPWFWYNAGGVLMNLLLVALSVVILRLFHLGIVGTSFFIMMAFMGLCIALINGIPMMIGGMSNDGLNIWTLWRHPDERRSFVRMLQTVGLLSSGKRMSELPEEWFEDIPVTENASYQEINNRLFYMSLLEDKMQLDEARQIAEEIMALGKKLPQLFRMEVAGERVMLELMTTKRPEVIDELWDKQLSRYTEMNSKYSPIKCAVLYTVELLHNQDSAKADTYKQQLEEHKYDYTMPGEARTAIALVNTVLEVQLYRNE